MTSPKNPDNDPALNISLSRSQSVPAFSSRPMVPAYCSMGKEPTLSGIDPEEEEWEARQQQTGAAGRLVVYDKIDNPKDDILLRGGSGRRVVVTTVTEGGRASQAGVKAGDVLVSVDGKKDFMEMSAEVFHMNLKSPVTLVFMGFVGKLQAEVRLNHRPKICGLPTQHQIAVGNRRSPVHVVDEVVFRPGSATLFLATTAHKKNQRSSYARSWCSDTGASGDECDALSIAQEGDCTGAIDGAEGTGGTCEESPRENDFAAVYELRRHEAWNIVTRAMWRARTAAPIAPRPSYVSPGQPVGDHAPPTISPRELDRRIPQPADRHPSKSYHFTADTTQDSLDGLQHDTVYV